MFFHFFRGKLITIQKQFFNRRKTVSYTFDIWRIAEDYFNTVEQAKLKGSDLKIHLTGEMFLVLSIWGKYQRRYTGIQGFDIDGNVKTNSGVNLDDDEWGMVSHNFDSIKEAFTGKKDAMKDIFTRPKKDRNIVRVYKAEWFLNNKLITNCQSGREFFLRKKVEDNAMCRKPTLGIDYPDKNVQPELRVDCEVRPAPDDTMLMNLVLVETIDRIIQAETKANCEACQVNSDSQFDHCQSGNCLDDELDRYDVSMLPSFLNIKITTLMNVFDQLQKDFGLKQILSSQLAKCALAYILRIQIANQIRNPALHNSTLAEAVRSAYISVTDQ